MTHIGRFDMKRMYNRHGKSLMTLAILIVVVSIVYMIVDGVISYKGNNDREGFYTSSNCDNVKKYRDDTTKPIMDNKYFSYTLRDYYIKCAFNSCASGNFEGGMVEMCALDECLRNGTRGLDFEIYSVNKEPVISCSDNKGNRTVKGTENNLKLDSVLKYLDRYAFLQSFCPKNHSDPLLINLRIHIEDAGLIPVYDKIGTMIASVFGKNNRLIGQPYRVKNGGKNIGEMKLTDCKEKVIIIVDGGNMVFKDSKLYSYTNIISSAFSTDMRVYTSSDIKSIDIDDELKNELVIHNREKMTISIPDGNRYPTNIESNIHRDMGITMNFTCHNVDDDYIHDYHRFFSENGCSFVLKPEGLRSKPIEPVKIKEKYVRKEVTNNGPFYEISL